MIFSRVKGSWRYCIIAMDTEEDEDAWEPWDTCLALPMIVEYEGNDMLKLVKEDEYSSSDDEEE